VQLFTKWHTRDRHFHIAMDKPKMKFFFFALKVSEWGMMYSISADQKVSQLTEKDIQSKLDLLFKKNFYDVAIKYFYVSFWH
jgi:hypothetical protein